MVASKPKLLIGGQLRDAENSYPVIYPATEQEIARAPDASDSDIDKAIAAARHAFDNSSWATDHRLRARCLRQLKQALDDDFPALQEITIAEAGVPIMWTDGPQLRIPIDGLDYIADLLDSYPWQQDLGEARPMGIPTRRRTCREPESNPRIPVAIHSA